MSYEIPAAEELTVRFEERFMDVSNPEVIVDPIEGGED